MEITIKNTLYKLKYTLRALFIYEQITGKVFSMQTVTDEYLYLYCLLIANNPDMELSFDELIDQCDEDYNIMLQFKRFLKNEMDKQSAFLTEQLDDKKKL